MDTTRFDRLTTSLAATSSRRGALRFLSAAAFGAGSLALLGADDAGAKKRKKGKKGSGGSNAPSSGNGSGGNSTPRDRCPVSRPSPNAPRCGGIGDMACTCNKAVEGNNVCVEFLETCAGLHSCTSTSDCRELAGFHYVCQAANSGACGQVCVPECDSPDA